jgi:hypothetical protein
MECLMIVTKMTLTIQAIVRSQHPNAMLQILAVKLLLILLPHFLMEEWSYTGDFLMEQYSIVLKRQYLLIAKPQKLIKHFLSLILTQLKRNLSMLIAVLEGSLRQYLSMN